MQVRRCQRPSPASTAAAGSLDSGVSRLVARPAAEAPRVLIEIWGIAGDARWGLSGADAALGLGWLEVLDAL
jgi:hypothetical protein